MGLDNVKAILRCPESSIPGYPAGWAAYAKLIRELESIRGRSFDDENFAFCSTKRNGVPLKKC
ncbi:hypothetical protein SP19_97 [Salmonella phage 19]|nr:hypothetical protein SP19_97 [Salmonella phage 19]